MWKRRSPPRLANLPSTARQCTKNCVSGFFRACQLQAHPLFGATEEHLVGAAGILTEDCSVWWSEKFELKSENRGMRSLADIVTSLDRDEQIHLGRIILLLAAFDRGELEQPAIQGITKLAKLDFLLRYPTYFEKAMRARKVSERKIGITLWMNQDEAGEMGALPLWTLGPSVPPLP